MNWPTAATLIMAIMVVHHPGLVLSQTNCRGDYRRLGSLDMPAGVYVDYGVPEQPVSALTVVNNLMYVKVRSSPNPDGGLAGVAIIHTGSASRGFAVLKVVFTTDQDHAASLTFATNSIQATGSNNRHLVYFTTRNSSTGLSHTHALLAVTRDPLPASDELVDPAATIASLLWSTEVGEEVSNPVYYEPASVLSARLLVAAATQDNGTHPGAVHVLDAANGTILWTTQYGDKLRSEPSRIKVTPVALKGHLAVMNSANGSLVAYDLDTRSFAWRVQLPSSFVVSLQVTSDSVLVRMVKGYSANLTTPFLVVDSTGSVTRTFDISDAVTGLSPYAYFPNSPVTGGVHYALVEGNVSALLPWNIVSTDVDTGVRRVQQLQDRFYQGIIPYPAALAVDGCRMHILSSSSPSGANGAEYLTTLHTISIATGQTLYTVPYYPVTPDPQKLYLPYVSAQGDVYTLMGNNLDVAWHVTALPPAPSPPPGSASFVTLGKLQVATCMAVLLLLLMLW